MADNRPLLTRLPVAEKRKGGKKKKGKKSMTVSRRSRVGQCSLFSGESRGRRDLARFRNGSRREIAKKSISIVKVARAGERKVTSL